MYKLLENGQVLKVIREGIEVAHTMSAIIELSNKIATINELINIPIEYKVFDLELGNHVIDISINKDVEVYLNGKLIGLETIVGGQGNIEFESAEAGTFTIKVEDVSCEVIVNEN